MNKNKKSNIMYIFIALLAITIMTMSLITINTNLQYKLKTAINKITNVTSIPSIHIYKTQEKFKLYDYPQNLPSELKGNKYEVTVEGHKLNLYKDINAWDNEVDFGIFELKENNSVEIKIKPNFKYDKYVILSSNDINYSKMKKSNISSKVKDGTISFKLKNSKAKISIVFSTNNNKKIDTNDYHDSVIHLFTNPLNEEYAETIKKLAEDNKTDDDGKKVIYYGPGFYDLYKENDENSKNNLTIDSNTHLYISGGAVFASSIRVASAKNVLIEGSGIVMAYNSNGTDKSWPSKKNGHCIKVVDSSNVKIKNILSNSHFARQWSTVITNSKNIVLDNYKVVSPQYASTDALDIINSQHITINNSFFRACDDAITIKGLNSNHEQCKWTEKKCDITEIKDININNSLLWNDANNSMVLGHETNGIPYSNINFKNIYVLYNNDDKKSQDGTLKEGYYHNALNDRAVMSIVSIDGSKFSDITWNNIYVNEAERLINLNFLDYSYNGSWKSKGDSSKTGEINGVKISNVVSNAVGSTNYKNQILISGYTRIKGKAAPGIYSNAYATGKEVDKETKNIDLSNIKIKGKKINKSSQYYKIGPNVSNVKIDGNCLKNITCKNKK